MKRLSATAVVIGVVLTVVLLWGSMLLEDGDPTRTTTAVNETARPIAQPMAQPVERPVALLPATLAPDTEHDFGVLQGRVLSRASGKGVRGAEVTFAMGNASFSTLSADEGHFTFTPEAAGHHTLVLVTAESFHSYAPAWDYSPLGFDAKAGTRIDDVVLQLDEAATIRVSVSSPRGEPVANAQLTVLEGPPAPPARTDADGNAQMVLAPETLVGATHADFGPGRARHSGTSERSKVLRLRLPAAGEERLTHELAGRVLDPDGAPIDGARVSAQQRRPHPGADGDLMRNYEARSRDSGAFVFDGVEPGTYRVTARAPQLAAVSAEGVVTPTTDLELVLQPGAILLGRVTNMENGQPISVFTLILQPQRGRSTSRAIFERAGTYMLRDLAAGLYRVTAVARGFAPSKAVSVTLGERPGRVDFGLQRGARLFGRVLDGETSAPIAQARVAIEGGVHQPDAPIEITTDAFTDEQGNFELYGLAAGLRSIYASAPQHHSRILSGLHVSESGDVGPLEIDLSPTEPGEEPKVELTGIGAMLSKTDEGLVVRGTLPGGGAAEVGLQPGDVIVSVEGESTLELSFGDAVELIRGPEGSILQLGIRRAAGGAIEVLAVTRRRVRG